MPIYDEVWEQNDFTTRQKLNLKTLPKNHLLKLDALQFDFLEYKSNQLVACHIYERMMIQCMNQYGLFQDSQRTECLDAKNFFKSCVELNAGYGLQKKYWPENFVGNKYSRPVPHVNQLQF